jgi:beta-glucosidase
MPSRKPRFLVFSALATVVAALLSACYTRTDPAETPPETLRFTPGFMWGTATAAYQVEGGIQNDWSKAGLDAGNAVEHYTRYEEDFTAAAQMGTNAYRMSVEWARIEPRPGEYDLAAVAHYRAMLRSLKSKGITPMVTLFHFTSPTWFAESGGWTRPDNIQHFLRFTRFIVGELKDDVRWWLTLNEPLVYAFKCFDEGTWPPYQKSRPLALQVIKHLIQGHGEAYRIIHDIDPDAKVGFAKNITLLQPHFPLNPLDHFVTGVQSYVFNEAFWEAIRQGQVDMNIPGLEPVKVPYSKALKGSLDFIGINYYTRYLVTATGAQITPANVKKSALGWEIYPEGLYEVLQKADRYSRDLGVPIVITENGLDDPQDQQRPEFLLAHLQQIWRAQQAGINVIGYMHWSLIDNFEWAEAFHPKFGLMDRDRQWRPSAHIYQQIATSNSLPGHLLKAHLGTPKP